MNLTPANWKKSEVTEYKDYVKAGMRLFSPASGACKVLEVETDNMLVHFEDDDAGEFDEWFNMNDLQLSWSFSRKDKEFIELIASTKNTKDFNPATMTRATPSDIFRIWRKLYGMNVIPKIVINDTPPSPPHSVKSRYQTRNNYDNI